MQKHRQIPLPKHAGRYRRNTMSFYDNGQHVLVVEFAQVFITYKQYSTCMFSMLDPTETEMVLNNIQHECFSYVRSKGYYFNTI